MGPLVALAIFAGASVVGSREINVFERAAGRDIASLLSGDAKSVDVRVEPNGFGGPWGHLDRATITARDFSVEGLPLYTEPWRSQAARCSQLVLRLENFQLKGLRVEALEAQIPACRYDFGLARREKKFRLSRSGEGQGWVRVDEKDLASFILRKYPEIKQVTVESRHGFVRVKGYGEFLIVKTNFEVVARLVAKDGSKLYLADAKILFGFLAADEFASKTLLDTLNPVVDFDKDLQLGGALTVEKVTTQDGKIVLNGRTLIPKAVDPQSSGPFQLR
ncbi:MAG: LmeA family phospholipid-binding protein [Fimbriimonadaceae bacterium]|nr:LmeA family phospholipid-binding protein [Fimbriimonadaceae bacterium]QYK54826.1 MAG: LmeA family phospholipid-binding protein [Fimbriimonadaceae bacterium]